MDQVQDLLDVLSGRRDLQVAIAPKHFVLMGVSVFAGMLFALIAVRLLFPRN